MLENIRNRWGLSFGAMLWWALRIWIFPYRLAADSASGSYFQNGLDSDQSRRVGFCSVSLLVRRLRRQDHPQADRHGFCGEGIKLDRYVLRSILITIFCLFSLAGCFSHTGESPSGFLTQPITEPSQYKISNVGTPSSSEGRVMFWAGGCASCHAAPKSKGDAKLLLGGGLELKTPFGIFRAPNISPDKTNGIGEWSKEDFANAMLKGVSPDGEHYFPAFPYTSYARMTNEDVMNLWSYLQTLPPVATKVADHDVTFPFNIRGAVDLWKKLYFKPGKALQLADESPEIIRGQYLVEGPGHCGECHTPRNLLGGFDYTRWLAGGRALGEHESIPNITPHMTGLGSWTKEEIADSLEPVLTHTEFDSFGSSMEEVRENMAELSVNDRMAIAAYLKAVPAVPTPD